MFSSGPNYTKLKTHLRLSVNRLKLLEKKKTELTQKARKEIADYLTAGKPERARIRVEHIIREDYLVEAMEIVEMYCDLLLARFGLVTQMKELDDGIAEAVCSILWVAPRLQSDVQELKVISDLLTVKYGKQFAETTRSVTSGHQVSEKLMHKLAIHAPPKLLVEKYLIEIAKIYNVEYEPDPQVMQEDERESQQPEGYLIDLSQSEKNNLNPAQPPGFIGYPQPPALPDMPMPPMHKPFNYPPNNPGGGFTPPGGYSTPPFGGGANFGPTGYECGKNGGPSAPYNQFNQPFNYNIPPQQLEKKDLNTNSNMFEDEMNSLPPAYSSLSPDDNLQNSIKPKPQPRSKITPDMGPPATFPDLPNVPSDFPEDPKPDNDDIDFDDLSRRFEELKKKK